MNNLTTEQIMEVAYKSTGKEWVIVTYPNGGGIGYVVLKSNPDKVLWKPDLNGKEWQQAQALSVIMAAFNLSAAVHIHQYGGQFEVIRYWPSGVGDSLHTGWQPDILTAAMLAILGIGVP